MSEDNQFEMYSHLEIDLMYYVAARRALERAREAWPEVEERLKSHATERAKLTAIAAQVALNRLPDLVHWASSFRSGLHSAHRAVAEMLLSANESQIDDLLSSSHARRLAKNREILRAILSAYLNYVNSNLLLAKEFEAGFHDWSDYMPFTGRSSLESVKAGLRPMNRHRSFGGSFRFRSQNLPLRIRSNYWPSCKTAGLRNSEIWFHLQSRGTWSSTRSLQRTLSRA